MNTKLATSQIRLKNWAAIIQDRKQSGLSVNDYCSQHQLSRDAYYYWLRKIKENLLVESGFVEVASPVPFPLQKAQPSDSKEMMQLCFQGMQLDIPLSVSRDTLLMIIEVAAHAQ